MPAPLRAVPPNTPLKASHAAQEQSWALGGVPEPSPFFDLPLECEVLGALMMMDEKAVAAGVQTLRAHHFHNPSSRAAFEAILRLYQQRHISDEIVYIEPCAVGLEMRRAHEFDRTFGTAFLMQCVGTCGSAANIGFYIERLIDLWRKRQLDYLGRMARRRAREPDCAPAELLAQLRAALDAIESGNSETLTRILDDAN